MMICFEKLSKMSVQFGTLLVWNLCVKAGGYIYLYK